MSEANFKSKVLEVIRDKIVYHEYQPGQLLSEKELCASLGVSRTPIREAMIELKNYGLVSIIPRSGTYVTRIDLLELKNCYLVRSTLEGLAAQLATRYLKNGDITKLEEIVEKTVAIDPTGNAAEEIVRYDTMFHEILYENSYNQPLVDVLHQMEYRCMRGWYHFIHDVPETLDALKGLSDLLVAIKARDEMLAKSKMEAHVNGFIQSLQMKLV